MPYPFPKFTTSIRKTLKKWSKKLEHANSKPTKWPEMQPQAGIPLTRKELEALGMPGIVPLVVADPLGRTYEEMAANPAMKALMDRMDKVRMKEGDMEENFH